MPAGLICRSVLRNKSSGIERERSGSLRVGAVVNLLYTTSEHGRYFQEIGRTAASRESVSPPAPDEIQRLLKTAQRYGYWFATPEENASASINLLQRLAPKRRNDNPVQLRFRRGELTDLPAASVLGSAGNCPIPNANGVETYVSISLC